MKTTMRWMMMLALSAVVAARADENAPATNPPPAAASPPAPRLSEGRRAEGRVDRREGIAEGQVEPDVVREADRLVLAEHGPPGAVIDDEMNIVQVRGRTAPYLELSPGLRVVKRSVRSAHFSSRAFVTSASNAGLGGPGAA